MTYIRHLHYEEAGAGRPVILVHCPGVSHLYWRPLMTRLRTICRCIAIDVRGHGKSGLGDSPWRFREIAADIAMLTDRLHLEPAPLLVGYSSGGSICLQAALDYPDRFGGLALISAFSECSTLYLRSKVRLGLTAVLAGLSPMVGRNIVATNHATPEHARAMLPDALTVRPQSLHSFFRESLQTNLTDRLAEVRQPVLLLYGAKDEAMHPYYRKLRAGLPDARSAFVPGDHRLPTRHPIACADMLAEFISQLEPSGAEGLILPTFRHPGVDLHPLDGHR